jgi:outer membrane lipoprotein-sorting protein
MKPNKCIILILLALLTVMQVYSQKNANTIIQAVYNKLQKAKDYSVEANIKVDMPLVRILPVNVTIYFKQKDKLKVVSKSIAIVPRQGFDQISRVLADTNSFTAIIQGTEMIDAVQTNIVNVIPMSDTSDMILGKFWIDPEQSVILKSQITSRSNGTIETEYSYGSQMNYGLPDKMIFSVDVNKFRMPKSVTDEINKSDSDKEEKNNGNKKGKIYITLTGYKVNQGIPDSVFTK